MATKQITYDLVAGHHGPDEKQREREADKQEGG